MKADSIPSEEEDEHQGFTNYDFLSVEEEREYQEFKVAAQTKTADARETDIFDGWQLLHFFIEEFKREKPSAVVPFPRWLLKYFAFTSRAMLEDIDPRKALGLTKPRGRRPNLTFALGVLEFVKNQQKNGLSMTDATQKAADHFHKDFRQIQRIVAKAKLSDFL